MSNIAISVKDVSKTFKLSSDKTTSVKSLFLSKFKQKQEYKTQKVLNNVSFEVKNGDFFGIVGRNGSGKSTLLKLLAGIYSPDDGEISINGKLTPFIELGVGFNQELTARENVFLNGALLGFNRKEMLEIYDEIVEFAELQEHMEVKLKNFSSGMQVRLAFSIAIRAQTDILLLDEVLAVGDSAFQQKCFDYFEKLKEQKQTVVFISHDMNAVRRFCNKALYIKDGQVVNVARPNDIAQIYIEENDKVSIKNKQPNILEADVEIADIKLKMKPEVEWGNSLSVDIEINSKNTIKDTIIALAILDREGTYIAGYNIKKQLGLQTIKKGKNVYNCKLSTTSFSRGNYVLGCSLVTSDYHIVDSLLNGPSFSIVNSPESNDGYIVADHNWKKVL